MKRIFKMFLLAVLAGLAIGIGGVVYLTLENKVVGALMFTVGLYTICTHGLNLFTGKVGYLPLRKPAYLMDLLVIWLGNLAGTYLAAVGVLASRIGASLAEKAQAVSAPKLADGPVSLLILGVFCGMLMYIAVEGYALCKNPLLLFAAVAAFILCGFEHCIADMLYFSLAGCWSAPAMGAILVITVGNSLGGIMIPLVKKLPEE